MRIFAELPPEVFREQTELGVIYRKSPKPPDARLADLAEALAPRGRGAADIFHIVLELDRALDPGAPAPARRVDGAVVLAVDLPVLCGSYERARRYKTLKCAGTGSPSAS